MKDLVEKMAADLAILGGCPAFDQPLHVGRPNLGDRQRLFQRIGEALDRRWLTNAGPLVQEFEATLARFLGVKHCIAVCNATVGLEIAIRAARLQGEVIVPSFTFVATAHALEWLGLTPVFCDVDPTSHNLDPDAVEALVTPRTSAIIGVHVWGRPCAVEPLTRIAERHGLALMFDAAHGFGAGGEGRRFGAFGLAEVFSFHATKFFNAAEGGAITSNDDEFARRARLMTNFGFAGYDSVVSVGTNGKMSELSAAMGLTSFEALDEFIAVNRRNYLAYRKVLGDLPGVRVVEYDDASPCNYQYVVVEIDDTAAGLTRDQVRDVLWAERVLARRYFYPACHRMEPYASREPAAAARLPRTEWLAERVLSLPTGTAVDVAAIERIGHVLRVALAQPEEVRRALERPGPRG